MYSVGCVIGGLLLSMAVGLPHAYAQGNAPGGADAETLPLGAALPAVTLYDVQQEERVSTDALRGRRATAVVFWSNQCLWIDRYEARMQALSADLNAEGVAFVLVNANDATAFAGESRTASAERARGYDQMRYLRDENATLARELGATRTPHAFLFDAQGQLVYKGAVDDSPGNPDAVETPYLREAIQAMLRDAPVPEPETRPFGCMLKPPR